MITPQNLTRHELIGLKAEVVGSKNPANIGLKGKIVNETSKTLVIESQEEKRVFKDHVEIKIQLPDQQKVQVKGELLAGRPWDRIKKR